MGQSQILGQSQSPGLSQGTDDLRDLAGAEDGVDFRNLGLQLVAIPLRQAAGHDQPLQRSGLLQLGDLEDRVHRLLFRAVDERARVDDDDVGLLGARREGVPRLFREAEHDLAVDEILRTAEGDKTDLHS